MNDKIVESLKNIETHADIALLEIKRCIEAVSGERDQLALVANICRSDKHKDQIGDILRVCECPNADSSDGAHKDSR